jgi:uncharacterized membrane protein YphA (DoxX/SURF4 family)
MNRPTIVLLVLLRLAIGWHLFYEGWKKVEKGTFTSEEFLRESTGPLGPAFHNLAGDSLADRLLPRPLAPGEDPTKVEPHKRFPPALEKEWDAWFDRFVKHYDLSEEQKKDAANKLQQRKSEFVHFLQTAEKTIEKPGDAGSVTLTKTIPVWVEIYRKKQDELRSYLASSYRDKLGTLMEDEARKEVVDRRREISNIRAQLRSELAKHSSEMRQVLSNVLTEEQWNRPPLSPKMTAGLFERSLLSWADTLVIAGLLGLGACLMLGLFSRVTGVLAALLLLSFYLALPPWPGLPDPPQAEGNYLIINKNLIEVLALLLLASTAAGRWFGLDGMIALVRKQRALKKARARSAPPPPPAPPAQVIADGPSPS